MTIISVPFSEKEVAKALGAKWSGEFRSWYIPAGVNPLPFATWMVSAQQSQEVPVEMMKAQLGIDFDTDDLFANGLEEAKDPDDGKYLTLSGFMAKVEGVVKSSFRDPLWVKVEVSKVNSRGNHAYFDFVEYDDDGREKAKARGSLWASKKQVLFSKFEKAAGSKIQDGMKLLLLLRADFSAQYNFSFIIEDIDPAYTLGDMQAKLKEIRSTLISLGIYENNKSLPAPFDFHRVAVISPAGAAGLADFEREANTLQYHGLCEFEYYTATFQGRASAGSVKAALHKVSAAHAITPYDAVVIIRGGGAASDLAWLNDLELVKTLCLMPLPAITGIGHQIDNTLLDEVANRRMDTPSKVSAFIAGTIVSNAEAMSSYMNSIVNDSSRAVIVAEARIDTLMTGIKASSLMAVSVQESEIDRLMNRISADATSGIAMAEQKMQAMMSEIMGLSPRNTLARGYGILRNAEGKPVTSIKNISPNETVSIELRDGFRVLHAS